MKLWRLLRKELVYITASPTLFMVFLIGLIHLLFDPERHLWSAFGIQTSVFTLQTNIKLGYTTGSPFEINGLPFFLILIWPIVMGFYTLAIEQRTKTEILEKTLPVRGVTILMAKMFAVLISLTSLLMLEFGLIAIQYATRLMQTEISYESWQKIIFLYFAFPLAFATVMTILGQFAYLIGRRAERYPVIWMALTFIAQYYLASALVNRLNPLFAWMPKITYWVESKIHVFAASYFFPVFFISIGILLLNGWLYERWSRL